jgi:nondiscriminating glutamyl-tRNA synthetase
MTDSNIKIRTRFAPSPTGFVHIGNFRTALFSFLFCRHNNGVNILRIEDTDQSRFVEGSMEYLLDVMEKLHVEYDEGVVRENGQIIQKGDHAPYIQSQRLEIYQKHAQILLDTKKAYYCFCSKERLDEVRKEQSALKHPPMYDRHCRNLSDSEIAMKQDEFKSAGKTPIIRQAIPLEGETVVNDLVYGSITYDNKLLDDHVLVKADGFPTYHLAAIVDDHLMEISHVFRGEEWLPSAPKHLLLFQAFGWEAPEYAHMPLILNADKTKLSKRQGDVAVEDYLKKGYLPETLINFISLLGWNPKTEQEIFSLQELIEQFDLAKVNNSGAVFDYAKLDWMNSHYIRAKSNEELLQLLKPILEAAQIDISNYNQTYLDAVIEIEKERLKTLNQILDHASFYFSEPEYNGEMLVWKKADKEDAKEKLNAVKNWLSSLAVEDFAKDKIEEQLKSWIAEQGFQTGNVLWPLRVSLTGLEKSPSPFEMLWCLYQKDGLTTISTRIDTAISKL